MNCEMCGAELGENDSFCYDCGFNMSSSNSEMPLSDSFSENIEDKPIQSRFLEISSEDGTGNGLNVMDATFGEETHFDNDSSHYNAVSHDSPGLINALHYDLHEDDPESDAGGSKRSLLFPILLVLLGTLIVGYGAINFFISGSGDAIPFVPIFNNQSGNNSPTNTSYNDSKVNTTNTNTTDSICSLCGGVGTITCPTCHGTSFLKCSACGGDGLIGDQVCTTCGGKGKVICSKCKCTGTITCTKCKGTGTTSK
jgi:hypothetical protein